jgi:putative ABC transport system ATP-binding protein
MALVEIKDLTKGYYRNSLRIPVLEGVNLTVEKGQFLALMGPSGSGKTTLLNVMAGLDAPDAGTVTVDGEEITRMSPKQLATWRARHIGFVFQFYNLLPVLNAYQNVELPLLLTNLSKKERKEHVLTALGVVGLGDRVDHFPRQLSGGEQQRVGIARAIVSDPSDLDAKSAEEILTLLERLNEEFDKTIVMVTHDARAAERAKVVAHLDKGVLTT